MKPVKAGKSEGVSKQAIPEGKHRGHERSESMEQDAKGIRYQSEHFATVQGIMHYVNERSLKEEHRKQSKKKATGIDGVDKAEYDRNAEENIRDLIC